MTTNFLTFLGVAALVIVTPGQDTILTIRSTVLGGTKSGGFTALGVAVGQLAWTVATSVGLTALLRASEPAFGAVRFLGAAYLVFLGAQGIRDAVRGRRVTTGVGERTSRAVTPWMAFRQGALSNLSNPKMAMFFPSLLPQFAPRGETAFLGLLLLGLMFCLMTLTWLTCYAVLVSRAGDLLDRPRVRRTFDGVTGAVLVGFGLGLATQHR